MVQVEPRSKQWQGKLKPVFQPDPCSSRENNISYERVVRRVAPEVKAGCPALWEYLAPLLEDARTKNYFGAP